MDDGEFSDNPVVGDRLPADLVYDDELSDYPVDGGELSEDPVE